MNIGVIGLGLIGGSFALSAKRYIKDCNLYGEDQSEKHLKQALELEIVEHNLKPSNYSIMDVIILAIPVDAVIEKALHLLDFVNDNTLLIDVGSTKAMVCKALELHPKRNQFLATHPIAGTENSGPRSVVSGLYINSINIIYYNEIRNFQK